IPKGGTTEWQGWAFTTQEFWSAAERGQGRENFMRGRDVIAVADSDEWDNKTHDSGPFDSTLITPQYNVVGTNEATISFQSYYQQDGSQKGEVLISFDGAAPVTLAT
ncbi:nucleotide pyrophosphatase, partial [Vibrio vulnificus]